MTFVVDLDRKAHIKFVHERQGRDDKPIFSSNSKNPEIPENYETIESEQVQNCNTLNPLERPKPVLKPTGTEPKTSRKRMSRSTSKRRAKATSDIKEQPTHVIECSEINMSEISNSKDAIDEWMISEGVSLGNLGASSGGESSVSVPVLNPPQNIQQSLETFQNSDVVPAHSGESALNIKPLPNIESIKEKLKTK